MPDADTRVRLSALGQSHVLFSPRSGAIVLTNEFGKRLYQALGDGREIAKISASLSTEMSRPRDEIHRACVAAVDGWGEAGLFDTSPTAFDRPVTYRAADVAAAAKTYAMAGRAITVLSEDAWLLSQVDAVLSAAFAAEQSHSDETLEIIAVDGGYGIFNNGKAIWGTCLFDEVRHFVIREVLECLCGRERVGANLHAGCVSRPAGAAIIAGDSGAGKTTLTIGLSDAGCDYVADDHVMLYRDGRQVIASPVRASAKANSWALAEVAAHLSPARADQPRAGVRYAELPQPVAVGGMLPVRALLFPQFDAAGPDQWTRISPEDAFLRLISSGSRVSRALNVIEPLVTLADSTPAYEVRFSNSEYSVPTCLELIESQPT